MPTPILAALSVAVMFLPLLVIAAATSGNLNPVVAIAAWGGAVSVVVMTHVYAYGIMPEWYSDGVALPLLLVFGGIGNGALAIAAAFAAAEDATSRR